MLGVKAQFDLALSDLKRSYKLSDYEAVDIAWISVIKLANILAGKTEPKRLLALLECLPEQHVRNVLANPAVDELLNLNPPIESVLSAEHERLEKDRVAQELDCIRELRAADPKTALRNLAEILKRIRNRRAHGFKTPDGPRDKPILSAAARLLQCIGETAAKELSKKIC